jgi:hypothetical protein
VRAELRIFREQVLNTAEDTQGDALCGGRIMFSNVRAQGREGREWIRETTEASYPLGRGAPQPRKPVSVTYRTGLGIPIADFPINTICLHEQFDTDLLSVWVPHAGR